eukprot:scaffold2389_cov262-Pinguiococcus_pyrenoidosus.AAC.2
MSPAPAGPPLAVLLEHAESIGCATDCPWLEGCNPKIDVRFVTDSAPPVREDAGVQRQRHATESHCSALRARSSA